MKKKLSMLCLLAGASVYSQIGIGTSSPKATLHIEPSSIANPTGQDGILIPRMNRFPNSAVAKGQLIYMFNNTNTTILDGLYIWNGVLWDYLVRAPYIITQDDSLYNAQGEGFSLGSTNSNSEQSVLFSSIVPQNRDGFSLSTNKLRIGKKGSYYISFSSGLKTTSPVPTRATFYFQLKRNGSTVISTSSSIPVERISGSNIVMADIVSLSAGDEITVTVTKPSEASTSNITYSGFGNNALTLTYLHE